MFASNTSAANGAATYIEDVFSTYLYTGNGSTQTITNGIDATGKGALTWLKCRSRASTNHFLWDTVNGPSKRLASNLTTAGNNWTGYLEHTSSGFTVTTDGTVSGPNYSGDTYVSWTFRKQPKFFDVVTYTGTGANRTISHSLGSVPGCIIVKRTDTTGNWQVYHNGLTSAAYSIQLNLTNAQASATTVWNSTAPTNTVFSVGTDATVNASGGTYVAYVFAHNAGGFGLTGTDSVISCGSFTGTGSAAGPTVNLGYEPQWLLVKAAGTPGSGDKNWVVFDNMRGLSVGTNDMILYPNTSGVEVAGFDMVAPTSTGFNITTTNELMNASGITYIYIAIRRGPMKTPTSGTSVFSPIVSSATQGTNQTTNFPVDLQILRERGSVVSTKVVDRLRGTTATPTETNNPIIWTNETTAESVGSGWAQYWRNTGFSVPSGLSSISAIYWSFARAPGFFDVVCYTGTGVARTVNHNLGVAPELMIVKNRSNVSGRSWTVYHSSIGNTKYLFLEQSATSGTSTYWNDTTPTASVFTVGAAMAVNGSGDTHVAYLFASCPGVSKVGSYTGTGTTQQINCGFTGGARFVLIKRTDSTGDWYVWDSARGIVAGNDPYLLLNSTAAEVTSTDYVDTYSAGFEISSTAPAAINASGGTFIYLAIA